MIDTVERVSIGLLAGGFGTRLGGRDKGLLVVNGNLQVATLLHALNWPRSRTLISCRHNPWVYRHFAHVIVGDRVADGGPVAGIIALLDACPTAYLAIVPCDQGAVPRSWLNAWSIVVAKAQPGCFAFDQQRHTPLCLIARSGLEAACHYFDNGGRKLTGLYDALGLVGVECAGCGDDMDTWDDVNHRMSPVATH